MIKCDTEIIKKGLSELENKNYEGAVETFKEARKFYADNSEMLSVSLSFLGMSRYLVDKKSYTDVLKTLNEARYMADFAKSETAKIAIRASITGHLVLSTLHTNNSLNTIERLLDMDVERYLLSSSLKGIISQN